MATTQPDGAAPRSVLIERRGGIAGTKPSVQRDLSTLTADERSALDRVMNAPPPAAPAAPTRGMPMAADRFSYRVTVTHADGTLTTRDVAEPQMPEALERLCRAAGGD